MYHCGRRPKQAMAEASRLQEVVDKVLLTPGHPLEVILEYAAEHGGWEQLSLVSKLWRSHVTYTRGFDAFNVDLTNEGLSLLVKAFPNLKLLHCTGSPELTDAAGASIASLRCLEYLCVAECHGLTDGLLSSIKHLTKLRMLNFPGITDEGAATLSDCRYLTHLHLLKCDNLKSPDLKGLSNLRWLSADTCSDLADLDDSFQGMSNLQVLWLYACPQLSHPMGVGVAGLTSLMDLKLEYCDGFAAFAVPNLRSMPNLQRLEVRGCSEIEPHALAALSTLSRLDILTFKENDWITDDSVAALAGLSTLRQLHVGWCQSLTMAAVSNITRLTGLKVLGLWDWPELGDAVTAELCSLSNLDSFVGYRIAISGDGLENLCTLRGLTSLDLSGSLAVSEACLAPLTALQGLKVLSLLWCEVDEEDIVPDMQPVLQLTQLQRLMLGCCSWVTDEVVSSLTVLAELQELVVSYSDTLTDDGIVDLSRLQCLTRLHLTNCSELTEEGVAEIREFVTVVWP